MENGLALLIGGAACGLLSKIVFDWLKGRRNDNPRNGAEAVKWGKVFDQLAEIRYGVQSVKELSNKMDKIEEKLNVSNQHMAEILIFLKQMAESLDKLLDKIASRRSD